MRIIEKAVVARSGDGACDDDVIQALGHIFVVDAATRKTTSSGAQGEPQMIHSAIRGAVARLAPTATLPEALDEINQGVLALQGDPTAIDEPMSAVFVAYSCERREIWRVGDASWAEPGQTHVNQKLVDVVASQARAARLRSALAAGSNAAELMKSDPGRAMIMPLLRSQGALRNLDSEDPLAFGAIDGSPVPAQFQEVWPLADSVDWVVLATDGYPAVLPTLEQSEKFLAEDLERDPLRIGEFTTTKCAPSSEGSFDDRAYVRIAI